MSTLKKISKFAGNKQVIMMILVAVIIIAGAANYLSGQNETQPTGGQYEEPAIETTATADLAAPIESAAPKSNDYFTISRIDREQSRSKSLDLLQDIIDGSTSTQEARDKAQSDVTKIAFSIENESILESLIRAKGFEDVVVFISDTGVNVVVKTSGLTQTQAAQIKDLVREKVDSSNIKIIEIK